MRSVHITGLNQLVVRDVPEPVPAPGEVVVRLAASALNHRDLWIKLGQYAGLRYPCVPGSDGVGEVVTLGPGVESGWRGRRVIINPAFDWGDTAGAQGPGFSILGLPRDGTLAEAVAVPVEQLAEAPAHLADEEAAALPLAGLTAYRALFTRADLRAGERVLVHGVGGGVALFALQFARASGAEVWVTSSSAEKRTRAAELGAAGGFDYTETGWETRARATVVGGFDVIIDSAGGTGFEGLLDLAVTGGRVVFFGATRGNPPILPMRKVFWRQLSLLGTTMGSPADWAGMVAMVNRHRLRPVVDAVYPLAEAGAAFDRMERGEQFGKIVLRP